MANASGVKSPPVNVATDAVTPVVVVAAGARKGCLISNDVSSTQYLGKSNAVTAANGIPVAAGASLSDFETNDAWYAISGAGAGDLRVVVIT